MLKSLDKNFRGLITISGPTKSGKSKFSATNLDFTEGGGARVICYDIDKEIQKIHNWSDKLTVVINSEEFDRYLSNE